MKVAMLLAGLMLWEFQRGTPPDPKVVREFDELECDIGDARIPYRLYCPDAPGPWPLIIWFHGRGEAGEDNQQQLAWLELMFARSESPFPGCVVALQRPTHSPRWSTHYRPELDALTQLDAIIADVMTSHPIDPDRVVLCGISSGAAATWDYAQRHPRRFAAMVSLGTSVVPANVNDLASLAVWAFQSTADGIDSVESVYQCVEQIQQHGGSARFTIIESDTHDCWTKAFSEHELRKWMLFQRRRQQQRAFTQIDCDPECGSLKGRWRLCYQWVLSVKGLGIVAFGLAVGLGLWLVEKGRLLSFQKS